MAGAKIALSTTTANELNVDASTFNARVNVPITETQAGFVCASSEVDAGTVLTRLQRAMEVTDDYRLRVGTDSLLFNQPFAGTILSNAFVQTTSVMTYAQASGFGVLNSANAVAATNTINLSTRKFFPLYGTFGLHVETELREGNPSSTNSTSEWGLGLMTGTATPLDGVFWRRLAGGQLQGVVNFAGVEVTTNITTTNVVGRGGTGTYAATDTNKYTIVVANDEVFFWINDILAGNIKTPTNQGAPTASAQLPVQFRVVNTGAASAGRRIEVGFVNVLMGDGDTSRDWATAMAANGGSCYQTQTGTAVAATSNSGITALAAPTFTANTAPAINAIGGKWISASPLPAGTSGLATVADVHYPLFSYQNPAGTAAIPGRDLIITGLRIGETVVSAVLGATYTHLEWIIGVGSTAATLATVDAVSPTTTSSPKRVNAGSQGFIALAPAGTVAPGFAVDLTGGPLVVPPGAFLHIIQSYFGNAATGTLRGSVWPIGYFE
jgi:hypothetical protein